MFSSNEDDPELLADNELGSCQVGGNITTDRPKIKGAQTETKSPTVHRVLNYLS